MLQDMYTKEQIESLPVTLDITKAGIIDVSARDQANLEQQKLRIHGVDGDTQNESGDEELRKVRLLDFDIWF